MSERKAATEGSDAPKEVQEPKRLYYDSNEWPLEEDQQDATNETYRAPHFLLSCEEVERLLRADDESQTREEQELQTHQAGP